MKPLVAPALAVMLLAPTACGAGPASDGAPAREGSWRARRASHDDGEDPEKVARAARLSRFEPGAVAPTDRAAYFDAITAWRERDPRAPPDPEPDKPDAEAVRKVLGLESLVGASDPALEAKIREWIVRQAGELADAYYNETAKVLASPPSSPWHRAEGAWDSWVMAHLGTLNEQEAYAIGIHVFHDFERQGVPWFPGVDRFALGLAVADLWIREGHPGLENREYPASENVVCTLENNYGKLSSWCEDRSWWYAPSLASEADTQRLAQVVLARKDPMLTRVVAAGIGRSPKTLEVLHTWESDANVWRDALLVIAREDDWHWMRDWLFPEMKRAWTAHPTSHGPILYALALASGEYDDNGAEFEVNKTFDHFVRDFAGGATQADFASFLDQAPRAIEFVDWLMPDRTRGWSAADPILPRLDAYFALAPEPGAARGPGFGHVLGHMCYADHDLAGLAKLKTYFERRAPAHPGDRLNVMMDGYTAQACRAH